MRSFQTYASLSRTCLNESQATLVNPSPPLELVLESRISVTNTQILIDGSPRYKISTTDKSALNTEVIDLRTSEVMSSIRRRTFLPDKVQFARRFGGQAVKKEDWIAHSKVKSGHNIWTVYSESGTFVWRLDPVLRMVLSPEDSPDDIIAHVNNERGGVFSLVVNRAAEGSLDEIILAFVLIEQGMRLDGGRGQVPTYSMFSLPST